MVLSLTPDAVLRVAAISVVLAGVAALLPASATRRPRTSNGDAKLAMPGTGLKVEHVTKTFGSGDTEVVAVRDVSFSVGPGEVVLIMGPSGWGSRPF
jgi:ABC-type protease/lipase transport system fused ATPase/permease subunit